MNRNDLALAILEATRESDRERLNSGTSGNISVRTEAGMLLTPTGIPAAKLRPEMMVPMSLDGDWRGEWRPSSEWAMHAAIYKAFPAAQAVVHAHPDHCVALSCLREDMPPFHYMIASFGGNSVRCAGYAPFGSPELAENAVEGLRDRTACLLANHGMICYGPTLHHALGSAIKLETLARQYMLARWTGTPVLLGEDEMAEVRARYKTYGQQKPS
jgi:L-fuculose-phosphate aldolase